METRPKTKATLAVLASEPRMSLRDRFRRLFHGNEDWYGQYVAHPITGAKEDAYTKAGPIPDGAWDRHLAGKKTGIGIVPISDEGTCY